MTRRANYRRPIKTRGDEAEISFVQSAGSFQGGVIKRFAKGLKRDFPGVDKAGAVGD